MQTCAALGTTLEFRLVSEDKEKVERQFSLLWERVGEFEAHFSRFLDESELSRFNAQAGTRVPISPDMYNLLKEVQVYAERSRGLFNPFILPLLEEAGYTSSLTSREMSSARYGNRHLVSFRELEVWPDAARIPADTAIDLGGIGKGYLADQLGREVASFSTDVCLSLGGDFFISGSDTDKPWIIDIESAVDVTKAIAYYQAPTRSTSGIATSGKKRRVSMHEQAHIIDPRKGSIVMSSLARVTVVAPSATAADVYASCILIGGEGEAERLLAESHITAILLQYEDGRTPVVYGMGINLLP